MANVNVTRTTVEPRGALDGVTDTARFRRTNVTCIWGVSDPRKLRRGTVIGGWQRGSLTPQMPPSLLPTAAPTATRAAKSAARLTAVKLLIAKNIATSPTDAITFLSRLVDQRTAHEQGGTTAPESVFPLLFFAFVDSAASRGARASMREARSLASPMVSREG